MYNEGLTNQIADYLSRLGPLNDRIILLLVQVHEIPCRLHTTVNRIQLLHEATVKKDDLCSLKHIVQLGWPGQIQEVSLEIQPYWNFHEKISIQDGLLLKGTRIIIPAGQRQDLLKQLHVGHHSLSNCLHKAEHTI